MGQRSGGCSVSAKFADSILFSQVWWFRCWSEPRVHTRPHTLHHSHTYTPSHTPPFAHTHTRTHSHTPPFAHIHTHTQIKSMAQYLSRLGKLNLPRKERFSEDYMQNLNRLVGDVAMEICEKHIKVLFHVFRHIEQSCV